MAMSMRSRGAAAAARRLRSGVRPLYEDFKPTSELKHEEGADILLYHLPGFVKEQIRIIAESKGILRVRGERLLADNKWSRFQEEVVVPEHCNLNEIRAKFEDGILRIIMPKHITAKSKQQHVLEKEANNQSSIHEKPELPKADIPSSSTTLPKADLTSNYNRPQPETPPPPPQQHDSGEPQPKKAHGISNMESKEEVEHNKDVTRGYDGGNDNVKEKQGLIGNVGDKGKDVMKRINESYGLSNMKNLTKGHEITRKLLDEDRQVLVNMGVAILVIMALGASISYSLG